MEKTNWYCKKQYQGLDKVYGFDKKDGERINKKQELTKYSKSDLIYNSKFGFYKYHMINRFNSLSSESKHLYLFEFKDDFDGFNNLIKKSQKRKK